MTEVEEREEPQTAWHWLRVREQRVDSRQVLLMQQCAREREEEVEELLEELERLLVLLALELFDALDV